MLETLRNGRPGCRRIACSLFAREAAGLPAARLALRLWIDPSCPQALPLGAAPCTVVQCTVHRAPCAMD